MRAEEPNHLGRVYVTIHLSRRLCPFIVVTNVRFI